MVGGATFCCSAAVSAAMAGSDAEGGGGVGVDDDVGVGGVSVVEGIDGNVVDGVDEDVRFDVGGVVDEGRDGGVVVGAVGGGRDGSVDGGGIVVVGVDMEVGA